MDIMIDGFDKYGPPGMGGLVNTAAVNLLISLLTQGEWTYAVAGSSTGGMAVVAGLSSVGNAMAFWPITTGGTNSSYVQRSTGPVTTYIGGLRFNAVSLATTGPLFVSALKGATFQWSITLNTTGTFSLRTGAQNGTALGTSTASVSSNSVHYLEWAITVGATGAYALYLDGVSILSGTGNTRGDGANNNADTIQLGSYGTSAANPTVYIDDFYLFDSTGSVNNAVLNTSPRVETNYATGDAQTQFTYKTGLLGTAYTITTSTNAPGANELFLRRFTAPIGCTLTSVSCVPQATSSAAKFKAVLYPDSGGTPAGQTLTATGVEVVGATTGVTLTSTFSSPPTLVANTAYWIGFITDTSVVLQETDTSTTGVKAANTYGSGAPGTCPAITTGQNSWNIWGETAGGSTNWSTLLDNPAAGLLSYVQSSTVNQEDLLTFPSLSVTPNTIYTVAIKACAQLGDAGVRTMDLSMKSSSTDGHGSNTGVSVPGSFVWLGSFFDTDPNTSAAWGASALNSASAGYKVIS